MLLDLPDLVNQNIFEFLPTRICCKNFRDLNIIIANKYFRDFIKKHFKYVFLNGMIKTCMKNKPKKILKTSITTHNGNLCCNCARLNSEEQGILQNLLNRYANLSLNHLKCNKNFTVMYKSYFTDIYNNNTNTYKEELSMLNVHFNSKMELTNFIIKMDRINSNLWFDPRRCCKGSGCDVEILI